jgi:ABC-2 type transport system ATP-binding protein
MTIIHTEKLCKDFSTEKQSVNAVQSVNLSISAGTIFGFLGPNGAGKTTTMRMLTTLLQPTSGSATIAGYNLLTEPAQVRKHIGYVSQIGGLDNTITGRENLILQARLHGMNKVDAIARAEYIIQALQLSSFVDRLAATYSGGQRRRTDLALGMLHRPVVLFLDEPTLGLDPQSRTQLWEEIRSLKANGTTIFLTTHYLEEANTLCDRVAIINHGLIVSEGTPAALKQNISGDVIRLSLNNNSARDQAQQLLTTHAFIKDIRAGHEELRLYVESAETALPKIIRALDTIGLDAKTIGFDRPTLDDVFLRQTSNQSVKNSITL